MKKEEDDKKRYDVGRTLPPKEHKPVSHGARTHLTHRFTQRQPKTSSQKRKFGWKRSITLLLVLLFIPLLAVGIWDGINLSRASQKMFGSGNLIDLALASELQKAESGRVNILIVGYSIDDPGHDGADLTDSIILMSMNPRTDSGYMLSVPRDLYVRIPGYGYGKINEAYKDGGMGLLKRIVEENFDTQIGYYVLVNYAAVRETVNALGGITVDIKSSDPRGLFDPNISPVDGGPLKLANGPQKLDGQTALNLTRARGYHSLAYGFSGQPDFVRTLHQRQVFTAIKEKMGWKLILNPRKNGQLFDAMANNLKTDIRLTEVRPLYQLFASISNSQLESISLNKIGEQNLLRDYSSGNVDALIPAAGLNDYSDIQAALKGLN